MMKKFFMFISAATLATMLQGAQQTTLSLDWQQPPLSRLRLYIDFKNNISPYPSSQDIAIFFHAAQSADHAKAFQLIDMYGTSIINQMHSLFYHNRLIAKRHILHFTFDYSWSDENDDFEKLLQCPGIDINCKDLNGVTPLIHAVRNNNMKRVKLLLAYGADLNGEYKYGNALTEAAYFNFTEIGKFLLDRGINATLGFYNYAAGTELSTYALQRIIKFEEQKEHKSPSNDGDDFVMVDRANPSISPVQCIVADLTQP